MCGTATPGVEGSFAEFGADGTREPCTSVVHAIGGAQGQRVELHLTAWNGSADLELLDWNGDTVFRRAGLTAGSRTSFRMPWTGEVALSLKPGELDSGGDYALELTCVEHCGRSWSRHPLFFLHGFGSSAETWEDVVTWAKEEGFVARAASVSKHEPTPVRAGEWRAHLNAWRAEGTWRRVHLIGHSMGGLDARFLASHLDPEQQVVTVSTFATPHWGTPLADVALGLVDHDYSRQEVDEMVRSIAPDAPAQSSNADSLDLDGLTAALWQLSVEGALYFNDTVPDRPDVHYRSWAGLTCGTADLFCQWDWGGERVAWSLTPTHSVLAAAGLPSDGVVDVFSTLWGDFGGIVAADHFEMTGGSWGSWPSFDDEGFFRREVHRIAALERSHTPSTDPEATPLTELWELDW